MNLHLLEPKGITYVNDDVPNRGRLVGYHCKPAVRLLLSALTHDIKSLPRKDRQSIMDADECRYTIGFEIEKTRFKRGAIKRYPLFCGFERDGSCGVEAVTNVLPLLPQSEWRTKVFSLFYDAEKIIDSSHSPTDFSCGGHITVGIKGMRGEEILQRLRPFIGIVYALWRKRLKNGYCSSNLNLRTHDEYFSDEQRCYNGYGSRYKAVLPKGNCLEFRLVNRVDSVEQMIRRYELFYTLVRESGKRGMTIQKMWKKCLPIVSMMYKSDFDTQDELDSKLSELEELTYGFQDLINHWHEWYADSSSTEEVFENMDDDVRFFVTNDY
jgi:hypothetical protein